MSDATAFLVFLVCFLSTVGLVYACDRLNPDSGARAKEPRQ